MQHIKILKILGNFQNHHTTANTFTYIYISIETTLVKHNITAVCKTLNNYVI